MVSIAQGQFGTCAQAREWRAEIVSDVVERLTHSSHQRLIARQNTVEQVGQLVELVARSPLWNAQREVTGFGPSRPGSIRSIIAASNLASKARPRPSSPLRCPRFSVRTLV